MTAVGAGPGTGAPLLSPSTGDGHVPPDPSPEEIGATDALPRVFKVFGGIVAPTSLLTGLLFYFGRSRAAGYYRYFHVNSTVLDLSTNDYLFSGVDGLFVPIATACLLALVLLWAHRLLLTRVPATARRRTVRVLVPVAGVTGVVLVGLSFTDLLTEGRLFGSNSATGGLCLSIGVIALVYAVRLIRLSPPAQTQPPRRPATGLAEWAAAFLLVSIGLFWAADAYAFGVGIGGAITLHRALPSVPEAVLYSEHSLSLDVPGVTQVRCADPDAAYRFRYDGLRLVRQAGNQYLLLAATWEPATGTAVLIPRSGSVRLEFRPASAPPSAC